MAERPTVEELLEAVRRFLDDELIGELEGVRRFHARVASNALAIVSRELELEAPSRSARVEQLRSLLGSEDPALDLDALEGALVERIRAGDADAGSFRDRVLDYLRSSVAKRLAIDNPRHR